VSLERALNAVVSLFVREEQPDRAETQNGAPASLSESEHAELAGIWGSGLSGGEN
jgi:hypothetical protein